MKKILFFVFASLAAVVAFAQDNLINDVNAETRSVFGFHAIRISHAFDVYLTESDQESLAVSARDRQFTHQIKTEVKDGELHIWHDGGNIKNWNPAKMKLKVYISFKQLDNLEVSQGCHVYMEGNWKDNDLKKRLSATGHSR